MIVKCMLKCVWAGRRPVSRPPCSSVVPATLALCVITDAGREDLLQSCNIVISRLPVAVDSPRNCSLHALQVALVDDAGDGRARYSAGRAVQLEVLKAWARFAVIKHPTPGVSTGVDQVTASVETGIHGCLRAGFRCTELRVRQ